MNVPQSSHISEHCQSASIHVIRFNKKVLQEAKWLIAYHGRAYIERNNDYLLESSNIAESNLALQAAGEIEKGLANHTKPRFGYNDSEQFNLAKMPKSSPGSTRQRWQK